MLKEGKQVSFCLLKWLQFLISSCLTLFFFSHVSNYKQGCGKIFIHTIHLDGRGVCLWLMPLWEMSFSQIPLLLFLLSKKAWIIIFVSPQKKADNIPVKKGPDQYTQRPDQTRRRRMASGVRLHYGNLPCWWNMCIRVFDKDRERKKRERLRLFAMVYDQLPVCLCVCVGVCV